MSNDLIYAHVEEFSKKYIEHFFKELRTGFCLKTDVDRKYKEILKKKFEFMDERRKNDIFKGIDYCKIFEDKLETRRWKNFYSEVSPLIRFVMRTPEISHIQLAENPTNEGFDAKYALLDGRVFLIDVTRYINGADQEKAGMSTYEGMKEKIAKKVEKKKKIELKVSLLMEYSSSAKEGIQILPLIRDKEFNEIRKKLENDFSSDFEKIFIFKEENCAEFLLENAETIV